MIYFDNSATGGFKPECVIESTINTIKYLNANPGRSGHSLSVKGAKCVLEARQTLSAFFNNGDESKVIFTKNCSEALNTAIFGLITEKCNVITTCFEHNSVLRPLYSLEKKGLITITVVKPENNQSITASDIEKHLASDTKLVIVNNVSNVNGAINNVFEIGNMLKGKNVKFIVDGAQSAGHIKLDVLGSNITALCVAGHKGLYAIQGSGALILHKDAEVLPTFYGGTGTETFNHDQPSCYPERLEYGTLNLPAINSLREGVKYVSENIEYFSERLFTLTEFLIVELKKINGVKVYSVPNEIGIVAFSIDCVPSAKASEILSEKYNIAVRGGYHCAPLMHEFLHSDDGLIRVSLSAKNYKRELLVLIDAVKQITTF